MSLALVPSSNLSRVNLSSSRSASRSSNCLSIPWRAVAICCGSQTRRRLLPLLIVRAEQMGDTNVPLDPDQEKKDENKLTDNKEQKIPKLPNFSLPTIPSWAGWILGSILLLISPFYKRFLSIEDQVEKTTTTILDVVEKVAEVTDGIAEDLEKSLPENSNLKKVVSRVEKIAEEIDKDAQLIESAVKEVDDLVDELDNLVEPIIEGKNSIKGAKNIDATMQ